MFVDDFRLFHGDTVESLRTYHDFRDFACERIAERIHPKASSLERTASVAWMCMDSLKWLLDDVKARYRNIHRNNEPASSFDAHRWLFRVIEATYLAGSCPLGGMPGLAPDRESNPEFSECWPTTPGITAFCGAGLSAAEAVSVALLLFLRNTWLWDFLSMPDFGAERFGLREPFDRKSLEQYKRGVGDMRPLIPKLRNSSFCYAMDYMPPSKWTPADIDREYMRVQTLLRHEAGQALGRIPLIMTELGTSTKTLRSAPPVRPVKLVDFMRKHCEDMDEHSTSFEAKAKYIHRLVRQGILSDFPQPINNPKGNQTKLYDEKELRSAWPKIRPQIPGLQNLK